MLLFIFTTIAACLYSLLHPVTLHVTVFSSYCICVVLL